MRARHSVNINAQNPTPILIRFLIYFHPGLKSNKLHQVFYSVDIFSVHFILPTDVISQQFVSDLTHYINITVLLIPQAIEVVNGVVWVISLQITR